MERLEKVEMVSEKCGVSFEEAKSALEACDYDVLDAIIAIERSQKVGTRATGAAEPTQSRVAEAANGFGTRVKGAAHKGLNTEFVVERNGQQVMSVPVLFVVLGLLIWGATLWLMIIGLFFGFRYRIASDGTIATDLNQAMGKAADVADGIRGNMA